MKCPFCNNTDTKVMDSRAAEEGFSIKRRRYCEECKERFTTYERIETVPLVVVKQGGGRESFDRQKLLNGIRKSCNKRPVSVEQMENIVQEIETHGHTNYNREIPSDVIGEMVMLKLREVDQVAYVRFASVYRQFKDVDSFMDELSKLLKERDIDEE